MILKTICLIGEYFLRITVGLIRWFESWKDILNLRGNSFLRSMMIDILYFVVHSTTQLMQVSIDHFFWIYFVLTLLLWITILLNKNYQRYNILIRSSMFTYLFLQFILSIFLTYNYLLIIFHLCLFFSLNIFRVYSQYYVSFRLSFLILISFNITFGLLQGNWNIILFFRMDRRLSKLRRKYS